MVVVDAIIIGLIIYVYYQVWTLDMTCYVNKDIKNLALI